MHTYTHTHPHQVCGEVGAYLMADMAHISGLVAADVSGTHTHLHTQGQYIPCVQYTHTCTHITCTYREPIRKVARVKAFNSNRSP